MKLSKTFFIVVYFSILMDSIFRYLSIFSFEPVAVIESYQAYEILNHNDTYYGIVKFDAITSSSKCKNVVMHVYNKQQVEQFIHKLDYNELDVPLLKNNITKECAYFPNVYSLYTKYKNMLDIFVISHNAKTLFSVINAK